MTVSAGVEGLDRLHDATDAVQAVLTSPETAAAAAALVAAAGRPRIPRDTGALASSEWVAATAGGAVLDYTALHAVPVHALRPWIPDAIAAAEADILDLYSTRVLAEWD